MTIFDTFNETDEHYPIIFSIPHSGTIIPETMREILKKETVISNVDWFLKDLYSFLREQGFTVIQNNMCRYVADPNRDPALVNYDGNYQNNVVYQKNTFGKPLYDRQLSTEEISDRLKKYYYPYHEKLNELIQFKRQLFNKVYLIDLHSFAGYPSGKDLKIVDFVLGNCHGKTFNPKIFNTLVTELENKNFTVSNNAPFSGGYLTRHFGSYSGVESLQVEIRYNKYIEDRFFSEEYLYTNAIDKDTFNYMQKNLKTIISTMVKNLE